MLAPRAHGVDGREDLADLGIEVEAREDAAHGRANEIRARVRARRAARIDEHLRGEHRARVDRDRGLARRLGHDLVAIEVCHARGLARAPRVCEEPTRVDGAVEHAAHRVRPAAVEAARAGAVARDDERLELRPRDEPDAHERIELRPARVPLAMREARGPALDDRDAQAAAREERRDDRPEAAARHDDVEIRPRMPIRRRDGARASLLHALEALEPLEELGPARVAHGRAHVGHDAHASTRGAVASSGGAPSGGSTLKRARVERASRKSFRAFVVEARVVTES